MSKPCLKLASYASWLIDGAAAVNDAVKRTARLVIIEVFMLMVVECLDEVGLVVVSDKFYL